MISNLTSLFDNFTKFLYAFELLGAGFRLSRLTNLLTPISIAGLRCAKSNKTQSRSLSVALI